jgi:hypothetical protein
MTMVAKSVIRLIADMAEGKRESRTLAALPAGRQGDARGRAACPE